MRTEKRRLPHPPFLPSKKKKKGKTLEWKNKSTNLQEGKEMKNVGWRKGFIGSWDKAQPPGNEWVFQDQPDRTELRSFLYARCFWTTLGGARGKDLHFFRIFPPLTPPHSLCKFQLPEDEITCSLRVPAGSTLLEEFDTMGLFLRSRVSWDLRTDRVPSLALGQSLRPWCQKGLYSIRLEDGAS